MRLLRAAVFAAVCVVLAAAGHAVASGRTVPVWSLAWGWLAVLAVVVPLAGRERALPGIAALLAVGQIGLHAVFSTGQMCHAVASPRPPAGTGDGSLMAIAARLVCGGGRSVPLTPQAAREIVARAGLEPSAIAVAAHGHGHAAQMPGMVMPGGSLQGVSGAVRPGVMLLSMCSLPMLLGHLLAAVVAGWLLRRGEAALWRLIRLSVRGAAEVAGLSPSVLRRAYALLSALAAAAPRARLPIGSATVQGPGRHRTVWLRHSLARRGPPAFALAA
jgi:hypothetical protein